MHFKCVFLIHLFFSLESNYLLSKILGNELNAYLRNWLNKLSYNEVYVPVQRNEEVIYELIRSDLQDICL